MRIDLDRIREIDAIEDRNEKVLQAALYYASQGMPVIPLNINEKKANDKTLYTGRCSARPATIKKWFDVENGPYRGGNIAIGCGDYHGKGGVFAVDVDNKYLDKYGDAPWGPAAWAQITEEHGHIEGPVSRTPSGGIHHLTIWQENLVPSQNRLAFAIDTRGGHSGKISSHIAVWPSEVNGDRYTWEAGGDLYEAPQWLVESMGVSWKAMPKTSGGGGRGNENVAEADVEQQVTLERVQTFLDALDPNVLDYTQWVKVGQAIHSQHQGRDALDLWDAWSQRGDRYQPGECHERWPGFSAHGPVRMATLMYYVQTFGEPSKVDPERGGDEDSHAMDWLDDYNKRYALTLVGENVKVIRKEQVPDSIQVRYKTYAIDAFRTFRSNDIILVDDGKGNMKPVRKVDIWLGSPNRRTFDGMMMHPGKERVVEDQFGYKFLNTWAGFAVAPAPGDWGLMKAHILNSLCCGVEEHYEWLMDWMADMFQEPHNPKGCAVILGGKEGAGKGTLANAIAHIFGTHASIFANSKHLTSNFNDMLMDSVFVFADEVIYAGNNETAQMLKALVTEKKATREQKFGAKEKVDQFVHLMMATNNDWKVAAGPDSRRWFILQVDSAVANEQEYFGALGRQMANGGYEAMLHELLGRVVTRNLRFAPVTAELLKQRAMMQVHSTYDSLPGWIAYVLDTGRLGIEDLKEDKDKDPMAEDGGAWPTLVDKAALWEVYADWSRKYKPRAPVTSSNVFFPKLKTLGFDDGLRARRGNTRVRTVTVPPLHTLADIARNEMAIQSDIASQDQHEDM